MINCKHLNESIIKLSLQWESLGANSTFHLFYTNYDLEERGVFLPVCDGWGPSIIILGSPYYWRFGFLMNRKLISVLPEKNIYHCIYLKIKTQF